MEEITDLVIAEMKALVDGAVPEDELQLQKDQARAGILLSLEDSASRATSLAQSEMIHGRQIPTEETLANIEAVTQDDVRAVAEEFIRTGNVAFAALGDLRDSSIVREVFVI
jgi:predicted Zn-dependent peptidase